MNGFDPSARRRTVRLRLNEDLVAQARLLTDDLSGTVERLLTEYFGRSGEVRARRKHEVESTIDAWNAHGDRHGSMADEYSLLR